MGWNRQQEKQIRQDNGLEFIVHALELWADDEGVTFATAEEIKYQQENNLLGNNWKFLHTVEADTPEEAMAVHPIKMGWEPYKPAGEPQLCSRMWFLFLFFSRQHNKLPD